MVVNEESLLLFVVSESGRFPKQGTLRKMVAEMHREVLGPKGRSPKVTVVTGNKANKTAFFLAQVEKRNRNTWDIAYIHESPPPRPMVLLGEGDKRALVRNIRENDPGKMLLGHVVCSVLNERRAYE